MKSPSIVIVALKPVSAKGCTRMVRKSTTKSPSLSTAVRMKLKSVTVVTLTGDSTGNPSINVPLSWTQEVSERGWPKESRRTRVRLLVDPSSSSMNVASGTVNINTWPCCTLISPTVSTKFGGVLGGGAGEGVGEGVMLDKEGVMITVVGG